MLICTKEQGRCPSNQFKWGNTPHSSDPCPAHGLPCEGGGKAAKSRDGRTLGVAGPLLALLSLTFDRRWHRSMLRRCSPRLHAKNSQSTALEPCISRGVRPPLSHHLGFHNTTQESHNVTRREELHSYLSSLASSSVGSEWVRVEKYRSCRLPPLVYLGPLVHLAKGMPRIVGSSPLVPLCSK